MDVHRSSLNLRCSVVFWLPWSCFKSLVLNMSTLFSPMHIITSFYTLFLFQDIQRCLYLNTIFLTVFVFYRLGKRQSATVIYPKQWTRWDVQLSVLSRKLHCLQHTGTKWYISPRNTEIGNQSVYKILIQIQNTIIKKTRLTHVKTNKTPRTSEYKDYP